MIANARRINPNLAIIQVSAKSGAGMANWLKWISTAQHIAAAAE
jgi:hydrogenase nickel incorporation protein HypB